MGKVKLNTKKCKGCFLCVSVCPVKALAPSGELGEKGYEVVKADEVHRMRNVLQDVSGLRD